MILPLRHPAEVAKAAASSDVLSGGRLLLGVASGDRPDEYPALNIPFESRGAKFREAYDYIRKMADDFPRIDSSYGQLDSRIDLLPKPTATKLPLLITGASQQSTRWIAENGDGWMLYPRPAPVQAQMIEEWRTEIEASGSSNKPAMEPLYIDLAENPDTPPSPIHLGFHLGMNRLREYLRTRQKIGVNHVALNLRFNRPDVEATMKQLSDELLPEFSREPGLGAN